MQAPCLESPHLPDISLNEKNSAEERQYLRRLLTQPLPEIPPIYFYDDRGSELFEQITTLPVYYQTRTEISLLEKYAPQMIEAAAPHRLIELGSGAGRKIRLLLEACRAAGMGKSCTMLDINQRFLEESIERLREDFRGIAFDGILGDFCRDLDKIGPPGGRLIVFFGGTIGNLYPGERKTFFERLAAGMSDSDVLLLGVDLIKDKAVVEAAYNDSAGITADFNKNALRVLNTHFGADFHIDSFAHKAFFDIENAWIEMRLVAQRPMNVRISALDLVLKLEADAEIRTEISCKFSRESLEASAGQAGLRISHWFSDPSALFALAMIRKPQGALQQNSQLKRGENGR